MVLDSGSTSRESADQNAAIVLQENSLVHDADGDATKQKNIKFTWQIPSRTSPSMPSDGAVSLAARRKRSEIRRLRLIVAAALEDVDDYEYGRPEKKLRALPRQITDVKGEHCKLEMLDSMTSPSVNFLGHDGAMKDSCTKVAERGDHETVNADASSGTRLHVSDDVDGEKERNYNVENRSMLPTNDEACPSHCVISICGCSRAMEDCAIAVPFFISIPFLTAGQRQSKPFHFYGVYDGHGGPQAAEHCKARMHEVLATEMAAAGGALFGQWESCMQSCFGKVDSELCGHCPHGSDSDCSRQMTCKQPLVPGSVGSTAVVAVVGMDRVIVGNCGDSRAVLCRGGHALPLSNDHKANRPDEVARIEAAGGQVISWDGHRVCGVLAMSRALGDGFLKPFISGQPEVTVTERSDDDECLILATDGLWNVLSNDFVCRVARKALANWRKQHPKRQSRWSSVSECRPSTQETCHADQDSPAHVIAALLVKLALARNSKDNISVVVVDLKRL